MFRYLKNKTGSVELMLTMSVSIILIIFMLFMNNLMTSFLNDAKERMTYVNSSVQEFNGLNNSSHNLMVN